MRDAPCAPEKMIYRARSSDKGKGEKGSSAFYLSQQNRIRRRDLNSALLEE
jgi:hypothetical protein